MATLIGEFNNETSRNLYIRSEIQNRQTACLKLQEARNSLLPKLMSGEVKVQ